MQCFNCRTLPYLLLFGNGERPDKGPLGYKLQLEKDSQFDFRLRNE